MSEKNEYIEKVKHQSDIWIAELAALDARAREKGETTRVKCELQIAEFRKQLDKLNDQINVIRDSADEEWEKLRPETDTGIEKLKERYERAVSEFHKIPGGS